MQNNIKHLDWSRLCRLMHYQIVMNITNLRLCLAAILLGLYFTFSNFFSHGGLANFPICFYVAGLIVTIRLFQVFQHTQKANSWLMLPCSNLERFLSIWLLIMIGYPLAMLTLFSLSFLLAALIQFAFFGHLMSSIDLSVIAGRQFPSMMIHYFVFQTIIMLGFVTFRGIVLIKTALSTLFIATFFLMSLAFIAYISIGNLLTHGYCLSQQAMLYISTALYDYDNLIYGVGITSFVLFCTYITWLKMTEYEVV